MKIVAVIPARYASSRFPGKPLADICGKPMIWWVYQQALKVPELDEVYVATDDSRIVDACQVYDMNVIVTSSAHPTGTDRIAEVSEKISADLYVNIQGDEPLITCEMITAAIRPFLHDPSCQITNLMSEIHNPIEFTNPTVPKVLTNAENIGVYLTRSASPFPKGVIDYKVYKQVCVYGFTKKCLDFFKTTPRGKLERIEDIEILRFIENGVKVNYIEVPSSSIAVDTPNDLEKVKEILSKNATENVKEGL